LDSGGVSKQQVSEQLKRFAVAKEPILYSAGSANGSMTCPKCGYVQEARLDCRKCGVVFSKYYALFPSNKSAGSNGAEEPVAQAPVEQDRAFADLHLQVRELSGRFADIEFEKAERNQLRTDLRNLESQIQANLEGMVARLQQVEKRLEEESVRRSEPEDPGLRVHLAAILKRVEQIEDRLWSLDQLSGQLSDLEEKDGTNSQLMLELQAQHSSIRAEFLEVKSQLELVRQAHENQEPPTPIEDDVHAIRKNIDDLRQFLNTLGGTNSQ
jgi:chromosome segregation ATPase